MDSQYQSTIVRIGDEVRVVSKLLGAVCGTIIHISEDREHIDIMINGDTTTLPSRYICTNYSADRRDKLFKKQLNALIYE